MNQSRAMTIGAVAAGVVLSVSAAGQASADDSYVTVDAAVPCVGDSYNLTVPAIKIQTGMSSYHFLDGLSLTSATQIDAEQPLQHGQDATAVWTPNTTGEHKLWMVATGGGSGGIAGPLDVTVLDASDPTCTPSTAVAVTTTPVPTTTTAPAPAGSGDLGTWLSSLLSSLLSASA